MNLNKLVFYFFFVLAGLLTPVHAETVYKWIDEDGQVHYGGKAKQENAKKIEIKNRYLGSENIPPSTNAEAEEAEEEEEDVFEKQKRFLNALDAEKKAISDEKNKKKDQAELKAIRCNAARDQIKRTENSGALYDLDEKGNRILLNKKQYEQAMKQARARVSKWCY